LRPFPDGNVRVAFLQARRPACWLNFRHEFANIFSFLEITPGLVTQAMSLAESHDLRGYDAVQLAAALRTQARCLRSGMGLTLISADAALNLAAAREGLNVEDPNLHP
jgi:predicted nucleic acid-binding protein